MAPARVATLGLVFQLGTRALADGQWGCGVAVSGDWPNSGQWGSPWSFDLAAMMRSAAQQAGRTMWHYDWGNAQGGASGDWSYVGMDWCPGKPQPDPALPGMMGWNEPDNAGQCNHNAGDVGEFIDVARRFKAAGKFVVSPAPTAGGDGWMDSFLGALQSNGFTGVDFLAYHHYTQCNGLDDIIQEMEGVLAKFKAVMDKWNGMGFGIQGLWLSEVACAVVNGQWTGQCPYQCIQDTMRALISVAGKHPELKSWSWFSYNNFGNLWTDDAGAGYPLTDIGQWYFGNCNHAAAAGNATVAAAKHKPVAVVV